MCRSSKKKCHGKFLLLYKIILQALTNMVVADKIIKAQKYVLLHEYYKNYNIAIL